VRGTVYAACALAVTIVLSLTAATNAFEDPHGVGYDGRDWKAMTEPAKLAYLAGFLAGAAAMEAMERHRANPKVSVDAAVSDIAQEHTGAFPFGVNVYKARLEDFYFYQDKRTTKIYRALVEENTRLRTHH
jgi:hypothetical protein